MKLFLLLVGACLAGSSTGNGNDQGVVKIAKCCNDDELYVDRGCASMKNTNESFWQPLFENVDGDLIDPLKYQLSFGSPKCSHPLAAYFFPNNTDTPVILPGGELRLYNYFPNDQLKLVKAKVSEHPYGSYCVEKAVFIRKKIVMVLVRVCLPDGATNMRDLMEKAMKGI